MRTKIKKGLFRLFVFAAVIFSLLLIIVLNPALAYSNEKKHHNFTIYHNHILDVALADRLDEAGELLKLSEIYTPNMKMDICLNDGSRYPSLIRAVKGNAFAVGFYNKVVIMGHADYVDNFVELNGYKWNLRQLLAHEMIHCQQYRALGFFHSNPVANIPDWKWEGYAEYIARREEDQKNIGINIERLIQAEQADHNGWIIFKDETGTVISYYKYWLLMQYCIDIKKLSWKQVLDNNITEQNMFTEMMQWHHAKKTAL
ncbi:MAG: hypothetical protein QM687_13540 [Ferruginibacter sp.]